MQILLGIIVVFAVIVAVRVCDKVAQEDIFAFCVLIILMLIIGFCGGIISVRGGLPVIGG